jgi:uncharacterized membrane protein YfcA
MNSILMMSDFKMPLGPALLIIIPGILIISFLVSSLAPQKHQDIVQYIVVVILVLLATYLTDYIER